MDIENLNIVLGADASALERGLQLAATRLRDFSGQVATIAKGAGAGFKGFTDAARVSGFQAADNFVAGFKTVNGKLDSVFKDFDKRKEELEKSFSGFNRLGENFKSVGESFTKYVTLPIVAGAALSAKAAIDYESAFAGVVKTTNLTGLSAAEGTVELARLSGGLRELAKEIPVPATELAKIAESAGQLGIKRDNVLGFTRTIADLGVATNLAGEEAASTLAKFANITQLDQSMFSNLGSSIVALGNNFATTERDIAEMSLRIAGAGTQVGLTEAQILGFAASLSSVGINAEAGGTAFSTVLKKMQLAVVAGGKELEQFAKVAGLSGKDFAQTFKTDAAGAVNAFIQGLGNMDKASGEALTTLGALDLADIRVSDSLIRLAGAQDLSARATDLSTKSFKENNALTKEAETRYATTASQITIAKNKLVDLGITIGNQMLPLIQGLSSVLGGAADALNNMNPVAAKVVLAMAGIAAAIGPVALAVGSLLLVLPTLTAGFAALGTAALAVAPFAAAAVAVGALVAGLVYLSNANERAKESYASLRGANATLTSSISPLLDRYDTLAATTNRTAAEQQELATIIKKVESSVPGTVLQLDKYGEVMSINTTKTREFIAAQKELERATAAEALDGAKKDLREYEVQLTALRTKITEFNKTGNVRVTLGGAAGGITQQVALTSDELRKLQREVAQANVKFVEQEQYVAQLNATLGIVPRTLQNIIKEQDDLEAALTRPFLKGFEAVTAFNKVKVTVPVSVTPVIAPETLEKLKAQLKEAQDKLQVTDVKSGEFSSTKAEIKRLDELIKKYEGTGTAAKKAATEIERAFEEVSKKLGGVNTRVKLNIQTDFGGTEEKIMVLEDGIKRLTDVGVGAKNKGLLALNTQLDELRTKADNFKNQFKFELPPVDLNFQVTSTELDAPVVSKVMTELSSKLAEAQQYFQLYGDVVALAKDQNDAYATAVEKLAAAHVNQLNPAMLGAAENAQKTRQAFAVLSTMQDYKSALSEIGATAKLMGGNFDALPAKISATAAALQRLRAAGIPETSAEFRALSAELAQLNRIQEIAGVFEQVGNALGNAIGNMATGVISGKQLLKAAFGELIVVFAEFMKKKGKQLILMGAANVVTPGAQGLGVLQIAAGVALIAGAGAAAAYGSSLASGGSRGSTSSSPTSSPVSPSSNVRQTDRLQIELKMLPVDIRQSGKDLRGVLNLDTYHIKRYN